MKRVGLRRVDRDMPALAALALLLQGPRHTYEMHRLMVDTRKDFVTGLPRSLYHAVERLVRDELIAVQETSRDGARPERTIYALTPAGRVELHERVTRLLATPDPDATLLVAALSFAPCLSAGEAAHALRIREQALARQVGGIDEELASVSGSLPRLLLIEAEYQRHRLEAERSWVQNLIADIDSGRLAWPDLAALDHLLPAGSEGDAVD